MSSTRQMQVPKPPPKRLASCLSAGLFISVDRAERLLREGRIRINGKVVKPTRKLWGGETVEVQLPPPTPAPSVAGPGIEVLLETPSFLIINKPCGFPVEPEPGQVSIVELVGSQRSGFDVDGRQAPGVVHRLDKDTTGCLLLAKTDEALVKLQRAFEDKLIRKTYAAFVEGQPPDTGALDTPYAIDPANGRKYTTRIESPRRARLSFDVVARFAEASLVEVRLDTGRTHQIRVQMESIGHSVVGDKLYGAAQPKVNADRHQLHAIQLELREPWSVRVKAPLPTDMRAVFERLGV